MSEHEDFLTLPPVEDVGDVISFEFDESKVKRDGGKFSKTAGAGKAEGGGPAGGKFAQPGADAPPSPSEASDEDLVELEKLHIERYKRNPTAREKIKGELKEVKQEMERRESPPPSGGGGEAYDSLPDSFRQAAHARVNYEGGEFIHDIVSNTPQKDRDAVDKWLVENKHPLAMEPGTQGNRLIELAKEFVKAKSA